MFEYIKTDHSIEEDIPRASQVPVHRDLVSQAQVVGSLPHKSLIMGIEIHKPDVINVLQRCCRESMGSDPTTEIKNLA